MNAHSMPIREPRRPGTADAIAARYTPDAPADPRLHRTPAAVRREEARRALIAAGLRLDRADASAVARSCAQAPEDGALDGWANQVAQTYPTWFAAPPRPGASTVAALIKQHNSGTTVVAPGS